VVSQQGAFYTNGNWIEDTLKKLDRLELWKDKDNREKVGKDVAFCVLIVSLARSYSEGPWLSSGRWI